MIRWKPFFEFGAGADDVLNADCDELVNVCAKKRCDENRPGMRQAPRVYRSESMSAASNAEARPRAHTGAYGEDEDDEIECVQGLRTRRR